MDEKTNSRGLFSKQGLISVGVASAIGLTVLSPVYSYFWAENVQGRVKSVDTKMKRYLVFTDVGEDKRTNIPGEVFENTDIFYRVKFNSSDVQNMFEPGKAYNFKVQGWRSPFWSWYRNVISAEQVDSSLEANLVAGPKKEHIEFDGNGNASITRIDGIPVNEYLKSKGIERKLEK